MTTMKRRFVMGFTIAAAAATVLSSAHDARAQEIELTGPLAGAPSTHNLRLYRQGRFELAPTVSFSLLDEYRRTILVGAKLNYNITDWLAVGVWGAGGVASLTTDLTDQIDAKSPRDQLTATQVNHSTAPFGPNDFGKTAGFGDQTAKIQWMLVPQVTVVPFRGKLAILNKIFVDTDFFISLGAGFVGLQERTDCNQTGTGGLPSCNDPKSFQLKGATAITGTGAFGLTFYPSNFISFGVEYRAIPFKWNRSGFDSRGSGPNQNFPDQQVNSTDETLRFNQLVTIHVGFSFPLQPKIGD
jgi:outer membrane beta-barrel protein